MVGVWGRSPQRFFFGVIKSRDVEYNHLSKSTGRLSATLACAQGAAGRRSFLAPRAGRASSFIGELEPSQGAPESAFGTRAPNVSRLSRTEEPSRVDAGQRRTHNHL